MQPRVRVRETARTARSSTAWCSASWRGPSGATTVHAWTMSSERFVGPLRMPRTAARRRGADAVVPHDDGPGRRATRPERRRSAPPPTARDAQRDPIPSASSGPAHTGASRSPPDRRRGRSRAGSPASIPGTTCVSTIADVARRWSNSAPWCATRCTSRSDSKNSATVVSITCDGTCRARSATHSRAATDASLPSKPNSTCSTVILLDAMRSRSHDPHGKRTSRASVRPGPSSFD